MKSNFSLQISSLILCALPFLQADYNALTRLDITVLVLAVIAAAVTVNIFKQKMVNQ
jgi:hypothetical protein